ncbi:MAG: AAA family ATPase [Lachnospiraceae bacterium]|jgi:hypothetical protein|nr:AAA family ATPase [Lachnospiraceae bacterium]
MLKRFVLKNYKNFKEQICIDFEDIAGYQFSSDCITEGIISKMLIYGRNATGKTNLGKALIDICSTMFRSPGYMREGNFLNADAKENSAMFSYTFQFEGRELIYRYNRFSANVLQYEELVIDGTNIFNCDFMSQTYNFDNLKYVGAETANIERYLVSLNDGEEMDEAVNTKLPFLRWLISNVALENDSILIRMANYVRRMTMITANHATMLRTRSFNDNFCEFLEKTQRVQDLQDFLNAMGIKCKLKLKILPDGQRELYFAHEKLVSFFENASSGTLALVHLYRRVISVASDSSLLYLDEFDAFYHYEMAENVVKFLKRKYPGCQVIMTSHNTNLMTNRLMRPDCLFILSREGKLTALCKATLRELREGHNLEKMYISGEFEKYE